MNRILPVFLCFALACSGSRDPDSAGNADVFTERTIKGVKVFPGEFYAEGTLIGIAEEGMVPQCFIKSAEGDTIIVDVFEDSVLYKLQSRHLEDKKVKLIYYYNVDDFARGSSEDMDDMSGYALIELVAENEKFSNRHRYITE
ncbi:MAG: hypothetical protein AB1458_08325 [Bacteroidota bacterium]